MIMMIMYMCSPSSAQPGRREKVTSLVSNANKLSFQFCISGCAWVAFFIVFALPDCCTYLLKVNKTKPSDSNRTKKNIHKSL